jgi:hypothetical protein
MSDQAAVADIPGLAHALVAGNLAALLTVFIAVAGHALLDRHALAAADDVLARNFFANLAADPVADGAGRVAVVFAAVVAAAVATIVTAAVAAGVAARVAAIVVVVTTAAVEATLHAAQEGGFFAAFPVATVNNAALGCANFLAGDAVLHAGPLFGVGHAHPHAADFVMALGNQPAAGLATGASFRNQLNLADRTADVATFLPVAGLLDHVCFRDPLVAGDGAVLLVAASVAAVGLGGRDLLLVVLLQIVSPDGKCQHGCHSPSQHRHTNSLPDHAFSLFCVH